MYTKFVYKLEYCNLKSIYFFYSLRDSGGGSTFKFLWNFDGAVNFNPSISNLVSLSRSLFNRANAPEPYDSSIDSR